MRDQSKQDGCFKGRRNDWRQREKRPAAKAKGDSYGIATLDVVFAVGILLASFGGIFWLGQGRGGESPGLRQAKIYQADALLMSVGLDRDRTISLLGGRMQVAIRERKIAIISSDCPRHVCMDMGPIDHSGEMIACVPNKTLIKIESRDPEALDAVVY